MPKNIIYARDTLTGKIGWFFPEPYLSWSTGNMAFGTAIGGAVIPDLQTVLQYLT